MIKVIQAVITQLQEMSEIKTVFLADNLTRDGVGDSIPASLRLPAAGVKDSGEDPPEDGMAGGLTRYVGVSVALYVDISRMKNIGEGLVKTLGLGDAVFKHLHRNLLGLSDISAADYQGHWGSNSLLINGRAAQRIVLNFRYDLEEE
jgi:hypothetical protein